MSDLTAAEWQGLGAALVAAPIVVISSSRAIVGAVGGDLGILLACVVGAVLFLGVPIVSARTLGRSVPAGQSRAIHG